MNLRRALLLCTALSSSALLSGPALAQSFNWTGFYAGAGAGAVTGGSGAGNVSASIDEDVYDALAQTQGTTYWWIPGSSYFNLSSTSFTHPGAGAVIEGTAGYNMQLENFLIGLQASVMMGVIGTDDFVTTSTTVGSFRDYSSSSIYSTFYAGDLFQTATTPGAITFQNGTTQTVVTWQAGDTTFGTTTTNSVGATTYYTSNLVTGTSTSTYASTTLSTVVTGHSITSGTVTTVIAGRSSIDWLSTIEGRAGFVMDRTLFYVSAGLAVGQVTTSVNGMITVPYDSDPGNPGSVAYASSTPISASNTQMKVGAVVNLGVEYALTDHWIISGEGKYFNLGVGTVTYNDGNGSQATFSKMIDGFALTGGFRYKF